MYTRQNLALSLILAISMVGISYGADGILPGDGLSESTAYLIEDLADFDVFADPNNSATYWSSGVYTKLTCDPNLAGRPPYTTAVFAPDTSTSSGFQGTPFAGVFDGNGHIVRNLTIDTVGAGNYYLGLFGKIEGSIAEIKNLGLENINITSDDYSAALGGLCGYNEEGTIINCYAVGSITGDAWLGGLCGGNYRGTITNCYAAGSVTSRDGSHCLGSLCGWNEGGTITNCYATGSVTGGDDSYYLGGLCGYNYNGTISNCYATGSVTGGADSEYLGGLCGVNDCGTITNCFWDTQTSGMTDGVGNQDPDPAGVIGKTTEQMQTRNTFTDANWDFDVEPLWKMPFYENGYPILAWQWNGDGSQEKPYLIENMADFDVFANPCNSATYWSSGVYTKLTCDPNLTGRSYTTAVIAPDANSTNEDFDGTPFSGIFDGSGHVIGNLTIDVAATGNDYLGLFGKIDDSGAEVKNLGMENVNITGGDNSWSLGGLCGTNCGTISNCHATGLVTGGNNSDLLGGLCGSNYYGTITNCYATGSVTGGNTSEALGGLCGGSRYGTITNCYATGLVTGGDASEAIGGLCGGNSGTISNCYATGPVTGGDSSYLLGGLCGGSFGTINDCYATGPVTGGDSSYLLGGLCGVNGDEGTITNCYATGLVTGREGSYLLGGLCGYNYEGTITNCYATGSVSGNDRLGGLCGLNNNGTITNCFWDVETSGIGIEGDDNYGATGKTTEQMQTQSTFTDADWDFDVVPLWHMPFQATGYPMLGWQKDIPGDFTGRYGVYMDDFAILSNAWLSVNTPTANWNEHCDLNGSGVIDPGDLIIFANHWLCD